MNPEPELPRWTEDDELTRATRRDGFPRVKLVRPERLEVVLGRGGHAARELDLEAIRADGVRLTRRDGGGGAVVLDPGDVVVSFAGLAAGLGGIPGHHRRLGGWLLRGLERIGLRGLQLQGTCDLALGERKVGGASMLRSGALLHYTVSLLVSPDVGAMERYLRHPPREPDYRRGRAHREFVGGLQELCGVPDAGWLGDRLRRVLSPAGLETDLNASPARWGRPSPPRRAPARP